MQFAPYLLLSQHCNSSRHWHNFANWLKAAVGHVNKWQLTVSTHENPHGLLLEHFGDPSKKQPSPCKPATPQHSLQQ
jgi:hypothetical protein